MDSAGHRDRAKVLARTESVPAHVAYVSQRVLARACCAHRRKGREPRLLPAQAEPWGMSAGLVLPPACGQESPAGIPLPSTLPSAGTQQGLGIPRHHLHLPPRRDLWPQSLQPAVPDVRGKWGHTAMGEPGSPGSP